MTISITGTAQKQAWIDKALPPIEQVRPLVWSVPIPFAESSVRYTLCYLVTNMVGECIIIDPGWDSDEGWEQLLKGISTAKIALDAVVGLVSTHIHADHLGMVRRLADVTEAWAGMHARDSQSLDRRRSIAGSLADDRAWLARCGVPADRLESLVVAPAALQHLRRLARPTMLLDHGQRLPLAGRNLEILGTPGHTAGHICVVDTDSEVIFTGDHVLPRISPNLGLRANSGTRNALAEYHDSLDLVAAWDAFEVCPAHEYRFRGLAERSAQLKTHHQERGEEIIQILSATPRLTLWQIAERLTWSRGWSNLDGTNLRGALAETTAHTEYLSAQGHLTWVATDQLADRIRTAALSRQD